MPPEHIITRIKQIEDRIQEIKNFNPSPKPNKVSVSPTSQNSISGETFSEILQEVMNSKNANTVDLSEKSSALPDALLDKYQHTGVMPVTKHTPMFNHLVKSTNPGTWDHAVHNTAKKLDLDPNLIHAIIQTESNYNPQAVSSAGAQGLMQLMPETAKELGIDNVLDPEQNILGGATYLKQLLNQYKGDLIKSIAAYNAGPESVNKANGIPSFTETRMYIPKVLNCYYQMHNNK